MKTYFKHIGLFFVGLTTVGLLATPLYAANATNGKVLHDKKCMGCHDTRQYTRPNRIIHTAKDLRARIEFCDLAASANFSSSDFDNVIEYLNDDFYKFKK